MYFSLYTGVLKFILIYWLFKITTAKPLVGQNVLSAQPNEFPFIASIGRKPSYILESRVHLCTGTLISRKHILTAEHCVTRTNVKLRDVDVVIGVLDLRQAGAGYDVDSWISFNDWAVQRKQDIEFALNDIAILTLSLYVNDQGIEPAIITDLNNKQMYRMSTLMVGWGLTNKGRIANVLRKAKLRILTTSNCEKRLKLITNIEVSVEKSYVCTAANPHILMDSGDSGGPILDKKKILLGINHGTTPNQHWGNFTDEFIDKYRVNLHPSVDYYRKFIVDIAGIHQYCKL